MKRAIKTEHGLTKSRAYKAWTQMRTRCRNPNCDKWEHYGGRGIKVCDRWNQFLNFLEDMGHPPTDRHTLDRIDPDGNYEPSNCRWATWSEQQEHRRARKSTVWITHLGDTLSVTDWAIRTGLPRSAIYERVKAGWPPDLILGVEPKPSPKTNLITFQGESLSAREWSERLDFVIDGQTITNRIRSGWSVEDALTLPCMPGVSSGGWRKVR